MDHHTAYNPTMQHMVASAAAMQQHQHPDMCYQGTPYRDPPCVRDHLFFQSLHPALTGGIESYLDPKYTSDPAAFASRLPYFPFRAAYGMYDYGFEPAFIRKRNERERQRVKCVNDGYSRLREHLPDEYSEKRLSKVETLRGAIQYIKHLQKVLGVDKEKGNGKKKDAPTEKHSDHEEENEVPASKRKKSEESNHDNTSESSEENDNTTIRSVNDDVKKSTVDENNQRNTPLSSSCMFSNCHDDATSQCPRNDVTEKPLDQGWRQYSNMCLYSDNRRERKIDYNTTFYERSRHHNYRTEVDKGASGADTQGYQFHPYQCHRVGVQRAAGGSLYPQKNISRGLKQEEGPHDRRNPSTFYYQKFGLGETRYDQLDSGECYNRQDQRNAIMRGYGGGESDGFKSDNSPSSSCISTSP